MACEICRVKKIRCDSVRPSCRNCVLRSFQCLYIKERQKRRKLSESEIESRLHRVESIVQLQSGLGQQPTSDTDHNITSHAQMDFLEQMPQHKSSAESRTSREVTSPSLRSSAGQGEGTVRPIENVSCVEELQDVLAARGSQSIPFDPEPSSSSVLDRILSADSSDDVGDQNTAIWLRLFDGDEYTGPSSGISLLSVQGLRWISDNVGGSQALCLIFEDLRNSLLSHLRVPKCLSNDSLVVYGQEGMRTPLPPIATIWTYVHAYFDSVQSVFPVLERLHFVNRTKVYLSNPSEADASWFALLNAVLASGCRVALSNETADGFRESGREAWGYFQNALAVETQLVHHATSLTAVQAFVVMTIYAQGMSSPQRLEFTLCSIAARLAQSLGLHRRPPREWNLTADDQRERDRVFWVIYCLDKTISLRCGRPSVFDDDDISCSFPKESRMDDQDRSSADATNQGELNVPAFDFFLSYTRLARISGLVAKQLYSAASLSQPCNHSIAAAEMLLKNIEVWRQSIPDGLRPGKPLRYARLLGGLGIWKGLALHFGYYYVICAVHRRFTTLFQQNGESVSLSAPIATLSYMEAARSMILLTKHLDIESYTPAWLLFYYPMTALVTVFMHVVCHPLESSARNDIALMDVVVGFFGRLEFVTSGVAAFTKTGEFVRQARNVVDQACYSQASEELFSLEKAVLENRSIDETSGAYGQDGNDDASQPEHFISDVSQRVYDQPTANRPNRSKFSDSLAYNHPVPKESSNPSLDTERTNNGHDEQPSMVTYGANATSDSAPNQVQPTVFDPANAVWQNSWFTSDEFAVEQFRSPSIWMQAGPGVPESHLLYS